MTTIVSTLYTVSETLETRFHNQVRWEQTEPESDFKEIRNLGEILKFLFQIFAGEFSGAA